MPKQRGAAADQSGLDDWPACDQTINDNYYCDYEKNVNETSSHVHDEGAEQPQYEENYRDRPKHGRILARSELHPV